MRNLRLVLVGLLLAGSGVWLGATPSSAGGPTSVLVTSPSTGTAAALHVSGSDDYATLDEKLHDVRPMAPDGLPSGAEVNATWLIHDVTVWRVDRIRVGNDGSVAVTSTVNHQGGALGVVGDEPWMEVRDPAAVIRVLGRLGVLAPGGDDAPASAPEAGAAPSEKAAAAEAPASASGADRSDESAATGWSWGLGGLVLGVLLGSAATALARRPASVAWEA